ncbi:hypothetical protein CCAL13119_00185 [Campylobacter sp. RM13119]|uniref:hypothetical protein n=1 Tax=Campylobacter californiensis TaxID=1032243 RepID=UPI0014763A42|nr:hypothetical protein [Campylobacter sp. RM13119]MBE3605376.1 hypothetical protein [Campylobacter sp. RM13119]
MSIREKYISILRELNIEAQIMFKSEDKSIDEMSKEVYQSNYYTLFNCLIKNILRRYRNNTNIITFEENSKISATRLQQIVLERKDFPNHHNN